MRRDTLEWDKRVGGFVLIREQGCLFAEGFSSVSTFHADWIVPVPFARD